MYEVTEYEREGLSFIRLSGDGSYAELCPERGAIVTAFHASGKDLLYLNEQTLFNREKNVRGGIPVLFPMGGQLTDGRYEWDGKVYEMKNHGLARTRPWLVIHHDADAEHAEVTVSFSSDQETKQSFPFDFDVKLTYKLEKGRLIIQQLYSNLSSETMPIYPGFHPYFAISNKEVHVTTDATHYLDYNDNKIKPFDGAIDLTDLVEPVVFQDQSDKLAADFDESEMLVIEKDPAFRYIVLWTEKGKDYVCVEPWTAKKDEYNEKQDLLYVEKDHPLELSVTFYLQKR
ncbi:aldose epimerase [Sporolactobacillus pectinivorans]|uniref:aldose epimerase family protein n=1 Tax=Sporolactobacillus pectinivorans TaxID=1591408 RepID=UPI000C25679B|nr:aldose epimerase [Sporolactobacillus pectinivorans]